MNNNLWMFNKPSTPKTNHYIECPQPFGTYKTSKNYSLVSHCMSLPVIFLGGVDVWFVFFPSQNKTIEETSKKMASNQSIRSTFSKDSDLSNLGNDIRSARVIGSQWVSRSQIDLVKSYLGMRVSPGFFSGKLSALGLGFFNPKHVIVLVVTVTGRGVSIPNWSKLHLLCVFAYVSPK